MFLFNLGDKVFALIEPKNNFEHTSSKISDDINTNLKFEENEDGKKIETTQIIVKKDQDEKNVSKDEQSDKFSTLEKEKFYLNGYGEAWMKSTRSFIPAKIYVELLPIKETKLTEFEVIDAKITVGENSLNFNKGTAQIEKKQFTLNIISEVEQSIFFQITGETNIKIKDDTYNGKIIFEDQKFYLYEIGTSQFQLFDYEVTISSIP